jgi:predicted transcriptional regulator
MTRRSLTLREVARLSKVPYNSASAILAGRLVQPANLEKIIAAIESVPLADEPEITLEEFRQQMRGALSARPGKKLIQQKPNEEKMANA